MPGPTIHQRVHGWLWHWDTGPGWCRDGSEIAKLRQDGMRVLRVQCQDDGLIPVALIDEWISAGMQVWLAVRPSGAPLGPTPVWSPQQTAQFIRDELDRTRRGDGTLRYRGADLNFEKDVRDADNSTIPKGRWSAEFKAEYRRLMPTLPTHLDTVFGDFAGGINNVYTPGIRMSVQTYWGPEGIWDDPPTNIVKWCAGAMPKIPKEIIKPIFRVVANNSGQLPDWGVVFNDWRASGCKGGAWYYIDGADFDLLRWLTREAVRRGVAY